PEDSADALREAGFTEDTHGETVDNGLAFHHPTALLPRVLLTPTDSTFSLGIRVESIVDFLNAHGLSAEPEGAPLSRFRQASASSENGTRLDGIERRGFRGFVPAQAEPGRVENFLIARELWQVRDRSFPDSKQGYANADATLDRVLRL